MAILIVLLLIFVAGLIWYHTSRCHHVCISYPLSASFRVQEIYQNDQNSYRALWAGNGASVRIEEQYNILPPQASQQIQIQATRMEALYEKAPAPYPGEITDSIVCGKKFLPEIQKRIVGTLEVTSIITYLNDRLAHGACADDQVVYRETMVLFYCPARKTLEQLEFIVPKETYDTSPYRATALLPTLSCK